MGLGRIGWCVMAMTVLAVTPASGYAVQPAVPLEELGRTVELVCKATVVADRPARDPWFDAISGFEVREAELRVISILKGPATTRVVRFRHYAPVPNTPVMYAPQSYTLAVGRSYLVLAAKGSGGGYRQWSKSPTQKQGQGVMLAADARPHQGKTITEATWAELRGLLTSASADDVVYAIGELDELSGGRMTGLADLPRRAALDAIRPMIVAPPAVATAALAVFGAESPYFDDTQAAFWLAGIGKGTIPGIGPRKPSTTPAADVAVSELLVVADGGSPPALRAQAIRALGRSRGVPAAKVVGWSRDPDPQVAGAAVLVSAELADRTVIKAGATAAAPEVRQAAALAIGFTQDAALVPLLGSLLRDPVPRVRMHAALGLLSFALDVATPVMKANLGSDYRALFINALARRDPQPYLAMLAEVIEKRLQPAAWWGGSIPAGDSWKLLFEYVKARPAAELTAGKLDRSLDALERMQWFSSSEPRDLYALYLRRGLPARATRFRDATRKAVSYNIDYYFDMADKDPASFVP
jgi:hypothetical protein